MITTHSSLREPVSCQCDGDIVRVFVGGDTLYAAMGEDIASARRSIDLEAYILGNDAVGRAFVDALCERSRAGARVRVQLDAFGSLPLASSPLTRELRGAGVDLLWHQGWNWRQPSHVHRRNHRKLLVLDQERAHLGGFSLSEDSSQQMCGTRPLVTVKAPRKRDIMEGLGSIVVGFDFSDCSRVALGHAQRLASWAGAQVHPLHVVDTLIDEILDDAALATMQRGIHERLVKDARKKWDAFVKDNPEASRLSLDVNVAHRLVGIREQLNRHSADLLVLGAHGDRNPSVGLGTLASACVRSLPTDVLIVRDNYRDSFRTVVAGIDFSHTSRLALEGLSLLWLPLRCLGVCGAGQRRSRCSRHPRPEQPARRRAGQYSGVDTARQCLRHPRCEAALIHMGNHVVVCS